MHSSPEGSRWLRITSNCCAVKPRNSRTRPATRPAADDDRIWWPGYRLAACTSHSSFPTSSARRWPPQAGILRVLHSRRLPWSYRERRISTAQLRRLLGFSTRYEFDGFLRSTRSGWSTPARDLD